MNDRLGDNRNFLAAGLWFCKVHMFMQLAFGARVGHTFHSTSGLPLRFGGFRRRYEHDCRRFSLAHLELHIVHGRALALYICQIDGMDRNLSHDTRAFSFCRPLELSIP